MNEEASPCHQPGHRKGKHREQQRASEYHSSMTEFDKVMLANQDADTYDSQADDESEELEHAIEKEKQSQVKWRAARQKATEARNTRTIVRRQE